MGKQEHHSEGVSLQSLLGLGQLLGCSSVTRGGAKQNESGVVPLAGRGGHSFLSSHHPLVRGWTMKH